MHSGKWIPPYNLNDQYTDFYYISDDLKYMSIYYYGMIMLVGNALADLVERPVVAPQFQRGCTE